MSPYVAKSINAHFKSLDDGAEDSFNEDFRQANPPGANLPTCACPPLHRSACGNGNDCSKLQEVWRIDNCSPLGCEIVLQNQGVVIQECRDDLVPEPGLGWCCEDPQLTLDPDNSLRCGVEATNAPGGRCPDGQAETVKDCGRDRVKVYECRAEPACVFQCLPVNGRSSNSTWCDPVNYQADLTSSLPIVHVSQCPGNPQNQKCVAQCNPSYIPVNNGTDCQQCRITLRVWADNCVVIWESDAAGNLGAEIYRDCAAGNFRSNLNCGNNMGGDFANGRPFSFFPTRPNGTIYLAVALINTGGQGGVAIRDEGTGHCLRQTNFTYVHDRFANAWDPSNCWIATERNIGRICRPNGRQTQTDLLLELNANNCIRQCAWTAPGNPGCGQIGCANGRYLTGIGRPTWPNEFCYGGGDDYDEAFTQVKCCFDPSLNQNNCAWSPQACGQISCNNGWYAAGVERPTSRNENCGGGGVEEDEAWTKLWCCQGPRDVNNNLVLNQNNCFWTATASSIDGVVGAEGCGQLSCPEGFYISAIDTPVPLNQSCFGGGGGDFEEPYRRIRCCQK